MTKIQQVEQQAVVVPFDQYDLPSFPVEMFPNWLQQYVMNVTEASQTPIDSSGMAALSVLSTALSKIFTIRPFNEGSWTERNNLYSVVVLPSGERKSVVHNLFVKPIVEYERRAIQSKKAEKDAVKEDGKEVDSSYMPRLIADDVTPEKLIGLLKENGERMAILSSEGGLFEMLDGKRYTNTPNLDVYLKAYTGDYLTVDRVGRPSEVLYEPILTIGLFVQPSVLQGLPDRLADRGIFGRFLYAVPKSIRGNRDVSPKRINEEFSDKFRRSITCMLDFQAQTLASLVQIELILSEEAQKAFLDFLKGHECSLNGNLTYDHLKSWTERFPAHLLRIASLLHVAEQFEQHENAFNQLNLTVSLDTIQKVLDAKQYFIDHAMAAFGCIKSDEELENAKYLWNVLVREGKQDYRKQYIWQKTKGKFTRVERLDTAISILRQRSYLDIESDDSKPGRKALLVRLNPKAIELTDPGRVKHVSTNAAWHIPARIPAPKEIVKG